MKLPSNILSIIFNLLIILGLSACVGSGGDPTGPTGGSVGGVPDSGNEISTGMNVPGPVGGGGITQAASPQMPDVPVAPNVDVEDEGQKHVEFRVEGKIVSACQGPEENQLKTHIEGQLLCRWQGTSDPYTVCGKGRYLRIVDPVSHQYVDVKTSETESRFEFDFVFNLAEQAFNAVPHWSQTVLLASNVNVNQDYAVDIQNNSVYKAVDVKGSIGDSGTGKKPLPFDPGESYDPEDQNLPSSPNDLIVYAHLPIANPSQLGVQLFCINQITCEQTLQGFLIHLGPFAFLDSEANSANNAPACED